jgi:hypothetical protein
MSRRRVLLEARTEHTAWILDGPHGQELFLWLKQLGVPRQYDRHEKVWMVPRSRVADLVDSCRETQREIYVFGAWS